MSIMVRNEAVGQKDWVQSPDSPQKERCVILGKSLNLSMHQFSHLSNGDHIQLKKQVQKNFFNKTK